MYQFDPTHALMSPVAGLSSCVLQNMEKDKALERRFQQVFVKQPNVEDTVSPLKIYKVQIHMAQDTESLPEPFTWGIGLVRVRVTSCDVGI